MNENEHVFQIQGGTERYLMHLPQSSEDHIQKLISQSGRPYEEKMLEDMLERTEQGDLILDIGANIGNHTIFLAAHGRRVRAFEPNASLVESLRRSVQLNGLTDLVQLEEMAVGARSAKGHLCHVSADNLGQGRIAVGTGEISVATLDDLTFHAPVKAIKIDVEGMETAVLEGGRALIERDQPLIYVESSDVERLEDLLAADVLPEYLYVETYNSTATHLFIHRGCGAEAAPIVATDAPTVFAHYERLQQLTSALERQMRWMDDTQRELDRLRTAAETHGAQLLQAEERYKELLSNYGDLVVTLENACARVVRHPWKTARRSLKYLMLRKILNSGLQLSPRREKKLRNSVRKRHPMKNSLEALERAKNFLEKNKALPGKPVPKIQTPVQLDKIYSGAPLSYHGSLAHDELTSIVIPAYNSSKWLKNAIHAALSQHEVNVEVIVVDDGSTDDTAAIAMAIARTQENVRVVSLLRNFGCYYARNIGVMHARGDYVATLDSDDLMGFHRINRQLSALKAQPDAVACLCRTRRWTECFETPLSDLRFGENSLLWKRSILETVGWYDTCRFGADTEFRERIIAHFGERAIVRINDELYFMRTCEGSLALSAATSAYELNGGMLSKKLSPERRAYTENFRLWHKAAAAEARITFPQFSRPFPLGGPTQNASPSLGARRVGAMASFPGRRDSLRKVLPSLLEQLDSLVLYLNDYASVPDFCDHPRLRVVLGNQAQGDLRDNGKFFDLPKDDFSYVFTFDDDILYPLDYVTRMIHFIESFDRSVVVGVHGVVFPSENFDELGQRMVYHFNSQQKGTFVDLLGTGTTAWHSSRLKPTLADFCTRGQSDLWFARLSAMVGLPMLSVPREKGWLEEIARHDESLFNEAQQKPASYFAVYRRHLAPVLAELRPRDWEMAERHALYPPAAFEAAMGATWIREPPFTC